MNRTEDQPSQLSHDQQLLLDQLRSSFLPNTPSEPKGDDAGPFPLSFAQERMWLIDRFEPGSPLYNIKTAWFVEGELSSENLRLAFADVIDRHAQLRTRILESEDHLEQVITSATAPFDEVDLSHLDFDEARTQAMALIGEHSARPFLLSKPPFIRFFHARLPRRSSLLLITMHHIVSDGWSVGVFARDFSTAYVSRCKGRAPEWKALRARYVDYAVRQRNELVGEKLDRLLTYGKNLLQGVENITLPVDHERKNTALQYAAVEWVHLDKPLVTELTTLARSSRATPFMLLLTAFQLALYRLGAQQNHTIGSPIAGRFRVEDEDLIGFYANTLILRADINPTATFRQMLTTTRNLVLDAFDHQDLPFEKLVTELNPQRIPGVNPLFQVAFALQNLPTEPLQLPDCVCQRLSTASSLAKFDLFLSITPREGALVGQLEYNAELFSAATAQTIVRCFAALLKDACQHPDHPVGELAVLDTAMQHQIKHFQDGARTPYPRDTTVQSIFELQAARSPNALALKYDSAKSGPIQVTYAELNSAAERFSRALLAAGVVRADRVGLLMQRSPDLVAATLAILKVGGTFVPIDPEWPASRREFVIRDAEIRIVLTEQVLLPRLTAFDGKVVLTDQPLSDFDDPNNHDNPPVLSGDDIASVMYTSGSTGQPKGALISHRNIIRLVCGSDIVPFGTERNFLLHSPFHFDASTFELWGALLHGGVCVVAPTDSAELPILAKAITTHDVDVLWLTSSLFNLVIDEQPEMLRGVRWLLIGGEALSVNHVRKALKALPELTLVNGYGPTETTTFATCYPIPRDLAADCRSIPIGRPIANSTCLVLDPTGQACPPGVAGELHIGGDGVAAGYLGQPELTAARFIQLPGGLDRVYRTGDRVRWLHDGALEFLGRMDDQIKLNGFRIEPGEIVATLLQDPDVHQAAVIVREDVPGVRQLVAYITGPMSDASKTLDRLKKLLPHYMTPSVVIVINHIPLTASGKLDRQSLPAPDKAADQTTFEPASNVTEQRLVDIWQHVLGRDVIGIHDNFFALGGHSLLASRTCSRIGRVFGVDLPMSVLFAAPTIAELAEKLVTLDPSTSLTRQYSTTFAVVRPSARGDYVVCVGGRIAELLAPIPADIGILFLGSGDGDPVKFHSRGINAAVQDYTRAIQQLKPLRRLVISGFSYSGLVAYALTTHLRKTHSAEVSAVLLEPSVRTPSPSLAAKIAAHVANWSERIKGKSLKSLALGIRRRFEEAAPASTTEDQASPTAGEQLWMVVGPEMSRNVRRFRPEFTDSEGIHVVCGQNWKKSRLGHFLQQCTPSPSVHALDAVEHHDLIDDIRYVRVWRSLIAKAFPAN